MDLSLPVVDGWTATRRPRGRLPLRTIPIIALTAHAMVGDREKAVQSGCDDFETKPIHFTQLLAKIQQYLPAAQAEAGPEAAEDRRPSCSSWTTTG